MRFEGLGFRVEGLGFRVSGLEVWVLHSGLRVLKPQKKPQRAPELETVW